MTLSLLTESDFQPRSADDAAAHFGRKVPLTSEVFDRLSREAKSRAFRIAGVHKANLIQLARDIVKRAIRDGTPYPEVRSKLLALFDTKGVPRPALPRLRLMFQQNAHQAYNDERRAALDDDNLSAAFGFRQYLSIGNGTAGVRNVRPSHAALHGLVFAWDDPFWNDHTPPWEFGCRCFFRPLTRKQVARMGVKVRNVGFVRKRIRVAGQKNRGIAASDNFARGGFDLSKIDAELRRALEEMIG